MANLFAQNGLTWNWNWFSERLPDILAAVAVLVLGWLVALIISYAVRWVLRRTRIDDRLAASMAEEGQRPPDVSHQVSRVVFWVLMLFVLVGFFQVLGLDAVSTPLNNFLSEVFAYAPRLLAAAGLILLAWVVATVLRLIVLRGLQTARFDERFSQQARVTTEGAERITPEDEETPGTNATRRRRRTGPQPVGLSRTIADATYWLVWLLFIPAILSALALEGLLTPVQNLVNKILAFLPNLLSAAAILFVGWFVARIVQRLTTNVLAAIGVDELSERVGITRVLGDNRLSQVIGIIVHVLIIIPVIIAALNALELEAVTAPASLMLTQILAALPNIFGAFLVIAIAYVVARLVGALVTQLLSGVGFDRLPVYLGITQRAPAREVNKPSYIVGTIVTVAIILVAVMQALRLMNFEQVELLLANFLVFAGHVLLGLVIIGFGLWAANFVGDLIRGSGVTNAGFLAMVARVAILVLAGAMGLEEMGLAPEIVRLAFGLTLGAVAVAAAIAFGIGGREQAKELVEEFVAQRRGEPRASRRGAAKQGGE